MEKAAPPPGLASLVGELLPGAVLEHCEPLGPDVRAGATRKAEGYGQPLRLTVREPGGGTRVLVFRTMAANEFGHDRRSDRAAGMLLSHDTFGLIPDHVRALDVGAIASDGRLVSLRAAGEVYLLTTWAEGALYAEDLRRIAREGTAEPLDLERCEALARWLAALHARRIADPAGWRRAVRDLLGHGEGIFGMVDAYPPGTPGAPPDRLRDIERRCLEWRWKLRAREGRLLRVHGDFHPFNIVFAAGTRFTLLDASRGCQGDAADDVTALSVNYVFFGLSRPQSWARGLGPLWHRFWRSYLEASRDEALLEVAAPFLAWRALVVASPRFYPGMAPAAREALLGLAERALDAPSFDPAWAEDLFR